MHCHSSLQLAPTINFRLLILLLERLCAIDAAYRKVEICMPNQAYIYVCLIYYAMHDHMIEPSDLSHHCDTTIPLVKHCIYQLPCFPRHWVVLRTHGYFQWETVKTTLWLLTWFRYMLGYLVPAKDLMKIGNRKTSCGGWLWLIHKFGASQPYSC